jgi:TRAP transporter 4TM/12TM fusion protein
MVDMARSTDIAPPPKIAALIADDAATTPLHAAIRRGGLQSKAIALAIIFLGLFLGILLIYTAAFGSISGYLQRIVFVFAIISLGLLVKSPRGLPWRARPPAGLLVDVLLIIGLLAGLIHVLNDYEAFARRIGFPERADLFYGILYIAVTLEVTRRFLGWPILLIILLFVCQALFGEWFPGMFAAPNVRWQTLIEILFMQDHGIFGPTTAVAATYLMIFLIFGAMLVRTNAVGFFQDLSLAIMGRRPGGPAHVAVASSALLGTASGSVVGNVAGTGSFTIPLMKRSGFKPEYAGAVESVASSGAQIMPPIMGSAAFLMAGFMGINYWTIVVAAIIPAALYFIALFSQIALRAHRDKLGAVEGTLPQILPVLLSGGHFILAIGALVAPFFFGASPQRAALTGLIALFILSLLRPATRIPLARHLEAVIDGMANNIPVGAAVAAAGILMGTVWVSGAGNLLADFVIATANGVLPVALILTAIIALVLGMGLPTPAVYLTVAVLIVPGLVRMGAPELGSHLFAFYFGILANVTPPVALAAYAAASIAGADLNKTGYQAFKLAIAGFIVPFIFIYDTALLLDGSWDAILFATITAVAGVFLLAMTVEGWFKVPLTRLERIVLGFAAIGVIWSDRLTELIGLTIAAVVLVKIWQRAKRLRPAAPATAPRDVKQGESA